MFFNGKTKVKRRRDALCREAESFIQVHFVRERNSERYKFNTLKLKDDPERKKVEEWYDSHDNPESYSEIVSAYFKDSGKDENTLCEKVLLDKNYFTNLEKNPSYVPAKGEAVTICFAFRLTYEAARALLKSADYALTNSEKTDLIVRFFLESGNYSINDLNYVLNSICDVKVKDIR